MSSSTHASSSSNRTGSSSSHKTKIQEKATRKALGTVRENIELKPVYFKIVSYKVMGDSEMVVRKRVKNALYCYFDQIIQCVKCLSLSENPADVFGMCFTVHANITKE